MFYRYLQAVGVALLGAGLVCAQAAPGDGDRRAQADEQLLKEAGVDIDGPGLIAFLRKHTVEVEEGRLEELVKQLGADEFFVRERASRQLVDIGTRTVPLLEQALSSKDPEVVRRARDCLALIKQSGLGVILAAAVRTLARKKPEGTLDALLAYLVCAEQSVAEDIYQDLFQLAARRGKPPEALVRALKDKVPARRAAAGVALSQFPDQLPAVQNLLDDPDSQVRLHVGLALISGPSKGADSLTVRRKAVDALIDLLREPTFSRSNLVEEFLHRVAGDQAPYLNPEGGADARKEYHRAWAAWWTKHRDTVTAERLTDAAHLLGYTLIVLLDKNQIQLLDRDSQPRWTLEDIQFPLDVELLPKEHVLVAEYHAGRVTERDRTGKVVWEKKVDEPLVAQRLANGHTFIATKSEAIEVDKTGKEVFRYNPPAGASIMRARKLANGNIALVTLLGVSRFSLVNKEGKEIHSFGVNVNTSGGRVDVLPDGRVLIPEIINNRIVEYSPTGKLLWEQGVNQPIVAMRLPNGNTLVTSMTEKRAIELTRSGEEVWEFRSDTRVTRAVRRWSR
jgi:hypothetical protein